MSMPIKVGYADCIEILCDLYNNPMTRQTAVLLRGRPGTGKSSIGQAFAERIGAELTVMHPPRMNPVNMMGFPTKEDGMMAWAEPAVMHKLSAGKHVSLVEEVLQCGPVMQNLIAGYCLDRGVNEVKLSPDTFVILTGNNVDDGAGAKALMSHLGNRVVELELHATPDEWQDYMVDKHLGIGDPTADVTGLVFLRLAPQHLFDFEPDRSCNATNRSWELALTLNYDVPESRLVPVLMGILPEGIVHEYMAFRRISDRLPDPRSILENPGGAAIPQDPEVRYVLVAHMITRTETLADYEAYMQYVRRLDAELQTFYNHVVQRKCGDVVRTSATYTQWMLSSAQTRGAVRAA